MLRRARFESCNPPIVDVSTVEVRIGNPPTVQKVRQVVANKIEGLAGADMSALCKALKKPKSYSPYFI